VIGSGSRRSMRRGIESVGEEDKIKIMVEDGNMETRRGHGMPPTLAVQS
jgi:hypothetical protein